MAGDNAKAGTDGHEVGYFRIFWLLVENKTDILAFSAFILALSGMIFQAFFYFRGAKVVLFPPPQVLIKTFSKTVDGKEIKYVNFIARMAYVNAGTEGHNAIMKDEWIKFSIGGQNHIQRLQYFVTLSESQCEQDKPKSPSCQEKLNIVHSNALPEPIMAGNSLAHETEFMPRTRRCLEANKPCERYYNFLEWNAFLEGLSKTEHFEIEIGADFYGENTKSAKCSISVNEDLIEILKRKEWSAPSCFE
jgi:hypothetical protein